MDDFELIWMPSPNFFPDRCGYTPRYVIVHGTAGFASAQDVGAFFQSSDVATHFTIGRDGVIVQSVAEKDGAYGNGGVSQGHDPWWSRALNPNLVTLSIEHVKPSRDNSDELTPIQQQVSFRLIRSLCDRFAIPKRRADATGGITGHYSMDPVHRSFCPGPYPWDELFIFLAAS